MKKIYLLLSFAFMATLANATIHVVQVQGSAFSPATVNALCNDTIIWGWAGSGSHTTTSTTIPGCATAWNAPISAGSFSFAITVPCTGTYNYECTPHSFTGVINVTGTCSSGLNDMYKEDLSKAFPNPFTSKFTVETPDAEMIVIYNMVGEKIKTITVPKGQTKSEVNTTDLQKGMYFYSILREGLVVETKKLVKN
jgi:plastocyanin